MSCILLKNITQSINCLSSLQDCSYRTPIDNFCTGFGTSCPKPNHAYSNYDCLRTIDNTNYTYPICQPSYCVPPPSPPAPPLSPPPITLDTYGCCKTYIVTIKEFEYANIRLESFSFTMSSDNENEYSLKSSAIPFGNVETVFELNTQDSLLVFETIEGKERSRLFIYNANIQTIF